MQRHRGAEAPAAPAAPRPSRRARRRSGDRQARRRLPLVPDQSMLWHVACVPRQESPSRPPKPAGSRCHRTNRPILRPAGRRFRCVANRTYKPWMPSAPLHPRPPPAAVPRRARFVASLKLTGFRNYAALSLALDGRPVVLTGPNGAGKTNLLEAVSFLSPGRGHSPRPARRGGATGRRRHLGGGGDGRERRRHGRSRHRRRADAGGPGGAAARSASTGRRRGSSDALLDHLRVLWLTPSMDGLFTGPPADRRRFLDRAVLAIDKPPRHPRQRLREGDARPQPAARRAGARPALARRDRDRDGRARRRHRRGAARMGGPDRRDDRTATAGAAFPGGGDRAGGQARDRARRAAGRRRRGALPAELLRERAPPRRRAPGRTLIRPAPLRPRRPPRAEGHACARPARPASRRRC